jgi:hypothetical protein
LTPPLKS